MVIIIFTTVALHFRDRPAHILRRAREEAGQPLPFGKAPFSHTGFAQPWGMGTDELCASTICDFIRLSRWVIYTMYIWPRQAFSGKTDIKSSKFKPLLDYDSNRLSMERSVKAGDV